MWPIWFPAVMHPHLSSFGLSRGLWGMSSASLICPLLVRYYNCMYHHYMSPFERLFVIYPHIISFQIPGMTGYSIDVEALRAQQAASAASNNETTSDNKTSSQDSSSPAATAENRQPPTFSGWNLLCQAIDRVLFISYLAIILIFIASYLGGAAIAASNAAKVTT